jgi:hypothetical protein
VEQQEEDTSPRRISHRPHGLGRPAFVHNCTVLEILALKVKLERRRHRVWVAQNSVLRSSLRHDFQKPAPVNFPAKERANLYVSQ